MATDRGIYFDGKTSVWSFDHATLVVPSLPRRVTAWTDVFAVFAQPVVIQ